MEKRYGNMAVRTATRAGARIAMLGLAAGLVAACTFRPLYGDSASGTHARTQTQSIAIAETGNDRTAQLVRNALIDRLTPAGIPSAPAYRLEFTLSDSLGDLLVQQDAEVLRRNFQLSAAYVLRDTADDRIVYRGTETRSASLNRLDSEYSNVIAERDARSRTAETLATAIALRLGTVMATLESPEGRARAAARRAARRTAEPVAASVLPPDLPGLNAGRAPGVAKPPVTPVDAPPPMSETDPDIPFGHSRADRFRVIETTGDAPAPAEETTPAPDADDRSAGSRGPLFPAPEAIDPAEL